VLSETRTTTKADKDNNNNIIKAIASDNTENKHPLKLPFL
jgi:hypothetical protein